MTNDTQRFNDMMKDSRMGIAVDSTTEKNGVFSHVWFKVKDSVYRVSYAHGDAYETEKMGTSESVRRSRPASA